MSPTESDPGSALPRWVVDPSAANKATDQSTDSEPEGGSEDRHDGQDGDLVQDSGAGQPEPAREQPLASEFVPIDAPRIAADNVDENVLKNVSQARSRVASEFAQRDRPSAAPSSSPSASQPNSGAHRPTSEPASRPPRVNDGQASMPDRPSAWPGQGGSAPAVEQWHTNKSVDSSAPTSHPEPTSAPDSPAVTAHRPFTSQPVQLVEPVPTAIPTARPTAAVAPPRSIDELELIRRAQLPPSKGWRRWLYRLSFGSANPGQSPAELEYEQLLRRVRQPVRGNYKIAVLSMKGGVGKTTTTIGLGSTFAALRGDRVIAYDANPDFGTLVYRIHRDSDRTVRDLLADKEVHSYSDVRSYTSQARSRLEVLASERDPSVSEAFNERDYTAALRILEQFYNIILTDCGTGLMNSAMAGVLKEADALVLVSSAAKDGARSAGATLEWLSRHGFDDLVKRTVVVINESRKGSTALDVEQLKSYFAERTRAVQVVPYDDHLAEGDTIDLELLGKPAQRAFVELAALLADDFPANVGRHVPAPGPSPW
ncbi:hypothetical protein CH275_09835 [Rhodococcus sp. 06-235-1A]|nr:hypothetical protein CH275_09835 [Rhodococcus sp. 06-235-1A]